MLKRIIILFLFPLLLSAQDVNIIPSLKKIEDGEIAEARKDLNSLKQRSPGDPSVLFLDAVLTEDGGSAATKYNNIYSNHPNSLFADASLYREFSYYFSLGAYNKAEELKTKLQSDYPSSPYVKMADRSIPDEEIEYDEMPVAEPKAISESTKPQEEKYNFTIQAGAFLNNENAQKLKSVFESNGWYSSIFSKEVGGSILNVVTVGKFKSESEAQKLLQIIKDKFNLNGRIIPLNK